MSEYIQRTDSILCIPIVSGQVGKKLRHLSKLAFGPHLLGLSLFRIQLSVLKHPQFNPLSAIHKMCRAGLLRKNRSIALLRKRSLTLELESEFYHFRGYPNWASFLTKHNFYLHTWEIRDEFQIRYVQPLAQGPPCSQ